MGTRPQQQQKMVAGKTSITEELLQSISLHQMCAIPAYLSESDGTTIKAFAKFELSLAYVLDTQNLYWPGAVNRSHVFDLFAEFFCHTRTAVKPGYTL